MNNVRIAQKHASGKTTVFTTNPIAINVAVRTDDNNRAVGICSFHFSGGEVLSLTMSNKAANAIINMFVNKGGHVLFTMGEE